MGGGGGGASSKLKKAARNFFLQTCGSLCETQQQSPVLDNSAPTPASNNSANYSSPSENQKRNIYSKKNSPEIGGQCSSTTTTSSNKNLCTICLDPLNYNSDGEAVFTAQCSHSFHFACISSNVRHGSVTCPICRAHWTKLPLNPHARCSLHNKTADPTLQILDDSIANLRVHRRRSFLHSDDPIEPEPTVEISPLVRLGSSRHNPTVPSRAGIRHARIRGVSSESARRWSGRCSTYDPRRHDDSEDRRTERRQGEEYSVMYRSTGMRVRKV